MKIDAGNSGGKRLTIVFSASNDPAEPPIAMMSLGGKRSSVRHSFSRHQLEVSLAGQVVREMRVPRNRGTRSKALALTPVSCFVEQQSR